MWLIPMALLVFNYATLGYTEKCITTQTTPIKNATPNKPCVFPFVYKNETFNGCTRDTKGMFWCSTKVEPRTHTHVRNNWGFCSSVCDRSCSEDKTCENREDCPEVNSEYERYKALTKNAHGRCKLKVNLKSLVCNKKTKKFCCHRQSKMESSLADRLPKATKRPKFESLTIIKSSFPKSCQKKPTTSFYGDILPSTGSCGVSCNKGVLSPLTFNGKDAGYGEFPWAVHLGYQLKKKKIDKTIPETFIKYKCGGTLINTWYVLTAAHCHGKEKSSTVHHVALGDMDDLYEDIQQKDVDCITADGETCMQHVQKILVDKVITHADFKKTRKGVFNDIALIRLKTEAVLNAFVQLACLPLKKLPMAEELGINGFGNELTGYEGTLVGCGYNKRDLEAFFEVVKFPIWSIEECQATWGEETISKYQICAGGGPEEANTCRGDSGAGLFIRKNTTDRREKELHGYVQVGMVSYGPTTCGNGSPGVFTRISQFITWIYQNLEP